jgi:hypothetical protein
MDSNSAGEINKWLIENLASCLPERLKDILTIDPERIMQERGYRGVVAILYPGMEGYLDKPLPSTLRQKSRS